MELFGSKKKKSNLSGLVKTSLAVEMQIKNTLGIRKLESMPLQAARAFQLASDHKATTADFVKVIEADEALSARIIRIANSVYFRRGEEARDIEKAVANVGLNELRCLISATMLRSLLQGTHRAREQIWANAVGTAICCRQLSHFTRCSEGEAFLCGLLHDVGKLIMIRRGGSLYEKVINLVSSGTKSFIEAEEEVFDLNHVDVGKWIGQVWHFPESAIRAIAFHHSSWSRDSKDCGKNTSPAMLVKACDMIAHAGGIGHPGNFRPFQDKAEEELPLAFKQLGIANQDEHALVEQIRRQFDEEFSLYQAETL